MVAQLRKISQLIIYRTHTKQGRDATEEGGGGCTAAANDTCNDTDPQWRFASWTRLYNIQLRSGCSLQLSRDCSKVFSLVARATAALTQPASVRVSYQYAYPLLWFIAISPSRAVDHTSRWVHCASNHTPPPFEAVKRNAVCVSDSFMAYYNVWQLPFNWNGV